MRKTSIILLLIFCFSLLPFNSAAATASTYEDYAECLSKLGVFVTLTAKANVDEIWVNIKIEN